MPHHVVDSGVDLFYTDTGSGPPVLLLHGWTCDGTDWAWLESDLEVDHRVINVDHRGHGRSSVVDGPYGAKPMAHDAADLLRHLEVDDVIVVGHRWARWWRRCWPSSTRRWCGPWCSSTPSTDKPTRCWSRCWRLSGRTRRRWPRPPSRSSTTTRHPRGCAPGTSAGSPATRPPSSPMRWRRSTKDPTASAGPRSASTSSPTGLPHPRDLRRPRVGHRRVGPRAGPWSERRHRGVARGRALPAPGTTRSVRHGDASLARPAP